MKKQQRFMKSGKLLLSLGMVFTMLTPANVFANEPITPSDGEKVETPTEGEVSTPQQESDTTDVGIMPYAFDTTAPVIEDVQFPQNGQTVNAGDTVEVFVKAYDDSKEISSIVVSVLYKRDLENETASHNYSNFEKTKNENEYKVSIEVENEFDSATISSVQVYDKIGNNKIKNYDGEERFSFNINKTEVIHPEVTAVELTQNGQTLQRGDTVEGKISFNDNEKVEKAYLNFSNVDNDGRDFSINLSKNASGNFVGSSTIGNIFSGKYKLSSIYIREKNSSITHIIEYADKDKVNFTVVGEDDRERPVIKSIEMDKNSGDILKSGDSVTFKIVAEDNDAISRNSGYIYISSSGNSNHGQIIDLIYNEKENAFYATFDIDDTTYPTEWYLSDLHINDMFGNSTCLSDYDLSFETTYPLYFYVYNDETVVDDVYDVDLDFYALTEDGYFTKIDTLQKKGITRRTSFKEANIVFPEVESVKGLKPIGWRTASGGFVDENSPVLSSYHLSLYAVYDKTYANINYSYPNKDGSVEYTQKGVIVENNTTYRQLLENMKDYKPTNISENYVFNGWVVPKYFDLDKVMQSGVGLPLYAAFKDKVFIQKTYSYYDTKGLNHQDNKVEFVDVGTERSAIYKELPNKEAPTLFKGLRFKKWSFYPNNGVVSEGENINAYAEYENCMIRFGIDDAFRPKDNKQVRGAAGGIDDSKLDYLYAMVVEYGDTFTVPEISGYKNITWLEPKPEGEYLVADGDRDFYGYGDKDGSDSSDNNKPDNNKPDEGNNDNSNTDNGNNGGNIDQETNNGIELPDTVIVNTIHSIINAPVGEKIEVNMGNATVVPVDVLAAAKGKDVDVVLNMGGYSWTINGKDILASNLKDINLEVKMDTQAVPSKLIQTLAGDNPTKQLSLTHNGDFGFKASLNLNIGSEYTGKYGNLYYYDSDGKLKFMNAGEIDANGNVSLEFSHASDYVIIINDQIMEEPIKDTATNSTQDPLSAMMVFCLLGCGYYVLSKKADSVSDIK